ncbi:Fpg/Nei family DNA glycosylase [Streptacidiphilus rugosus]|uniref:Fpg/Nei family DNA glycosylase n=1 Tax=Streptacidiphilus rugosus TaxID=405783 RepID=UPI0005641593|nr:DNA-formamidopyrimidine glycosylase family protein [Streptacidiphilus rugosus]
MPEGHTIHRLAAEYHRVFGGQAVAVSSPQGPFAPAAAKLDGRTLTDTDAKGKHLFLGFGEAGWVHIHLGLYGKVFWGHGPTPAPVGQVRLRIATEARGGAHADLRGPTKCRLISPFEKADAERLLGPDPLRPEDTGEAAWKRISGSRTTIAALLMDQKVLSGVGNVYRAEVLFRQGVDPHREGRSLDRAEWDAIWADLRPLMAEGVRLGRIDTVRPEHTPEAMGRPPRRDDHGGEVYVYRRTGQACLVCGTPVRTEEHAARNLFWCPRCQAA